jgi:hypothetical protein
MKNSTVTRRNDAVRRDLTAIFSDGAREEGGQASVVSAWTRENRLKRLAKNYAKFAQVLETEKMRVDFVHG